MRIVLSTTSTLPLYEQIERQVRDAVYRGELRPGDTLPSLRELARDLEVSLITVTRAYNDLAAEGLIGTRQGRGTVVLAVDADLVRASFDARVRTALCEATAAAQLGGWTRSELESALDDAWRHSATREEAGAHPQGDPAELEES